MKSVTATLLVGAFLTLLPAASAASRKKQAAGPAAPPRTTLRSSDLSVVIGRSRGQQELRHLSAKVKNVGRHEAHQVQVVARVPGGSRLLLRGPKTLQAGGVAVYTSSTRMVVFGADRVAIEADCLECR